MASPQGSPETPTESKADTPPPLAPVKGDEETVLPGQPEREEGSPSSPPAVPRTPPQATLITSPPHPEVDPAEEEKIKRRNFKRRLTAFYIKYVPAKLPFVDKALEAYRGGEEAMFAALVKKYGPEPTPEEWPTVEEEHKDPHSIESPGKGSSTFSPPQRSTRPSYDTTRIPPYSYFFPPTRATTLPPVAIAPVGNALSTNAPGPAEPSDAAREVSPAQAVAPLEEGGTPGNDKSTTTTGPTDAIGVPSNYTPSRKFTPFRQFIPPELSQSPEVRWVETTSRFEGHEAAPTEITEFQQCCFKHVFPDAFDPRIDKEEVQAIVFFIFSALLNIVSVSLNVFNVDTRDMPLTTEIAARIVFITELIVVYSCCLLTIATVVEVLITKEVSTDTAIDFYDLGGITGSFSTLQLVNVVTPTVILNRILPAFTKAKDAADMVRAIVIAFVWIIVCALACLAVVLKVSQVGFAGSTPFDAWTFAQFLKMFGLVLNIAKVDCSWEAEMSTLLKAIHKHYIEPGNPESRKAKSEGFYSTFLDWMGFTRKNYYEFFEAIFNHHFGDGDDAGQPGSPAVPAQRRGSTSSSPLGGSDEEHLTFDGKWKRCINFLAFIAKLNTSQLQRMLQMFESPLPIYHFQRKEFEEFRHRFTQNPTVDLLHAMESAIRLADPEGEAVIDLANGDPDLFKLTFVCRDRENVENVAKMKESVHWPRSAGEELESFRIVPKFDIHESRYKGMVKERANAVRHLFPCSHPTDDVAVVNVDAIKTPRTDAAADAEGERRNTTDKKDEEQANPTESKAQSPAASPAPAAPASPTQQRDVDPPAFPEALPAAHEDDSKSPEPTDKMTPPLPATNSPSAMT